MKSTAMELLSADKGVTRTAPNQQFDIESIFRMAIEKQGTAETMEKLMGIRRELKAEAAKESFDAALTMFQSKCPVIHKTKLGPKGAYKFAPLDLIIETVQPLLTEFGFSFSITSAIENNWVKAICTIKCAGHSENSEFKVPTDARNTMMSDPQRYAGSLTFAKRYAFCNALGILTGDEDRDAAPQQKQSTSGRVVTAELRNRFFEVTKDIHAKIQTMAIDLGWIMPDQSIEEIADEHIPTTKTELALFRQKVEAHNA